MSNVYANGREVSGKASLNKTVGAMPDVCLSPPAPPAGPIPIPYPNTSMGSDCSDGSKSVKIGGKEVSLKNASVYKKSMGNQPATRNFGANVITHNLEGPMRFAAWSSDVKIEGQNAVRHMDLTTHNHVNGSGGAIGTNLARVGPSPKTKDCEKLKALNDADRERMADSDKKTVSDLARARRKGFRANAIAHAKAGKRIIAAASRYSALHAFDNKYVRGLDSDQENPISPTICPDKPFKYNSKGSRAAPHRHAEARILESLEIPKNGRMSVTFAIDWQRKKTKLRKPCRKCQRLILHACRCLQIYVCSKRNKPESQCPKKE